MRDGRRERNNCLASRLNIIAISIITQAPSTASGPPSSRRKAHEDRSLFEETRIMSLFKKILAAALVKAVRKRPANFATQEFLGSDSPPDCYSPPKCRFASRCDSVTLAGETTHCVVSLHARAASLLRKNFIKTLSILKANINNFTLRKHEICDKKACHS